MSFALDPGECLLVVGPSGSGKSTLALALAGLIPTEIAGESSGRLTVDDRQPTNDGRAGLLFQDPDRQLVMERAEDDVAFGLENLGWSRDAMAARVPEALAEVGLPGFERRLTARLSGGEQQRLATAGVLAPRPGLLVLDEPTANLDPAGAAGFARLLGELKRSGAVTIVLIEHNVDVSWRLADRVLALGVEGRPIDFGDPEDVLARSGGSMRDAAIWLPSEPVEEAPPRSVPAGETPVLTAEQVTFGYEGGSPAVRDATLAVRPGERLALVGPNGSGKSTLGRLLVGLLRADSGAVRLGGDDPSRLNSAVLARRAGYVFQDPERQFLATTVDEEVRLGLQPAELAGIDALMERLDLPLGVFGARSPYRLSGGEQRRLSLACVLSRQPGLLVLDEPTFGQDRFGHQSLLAILHDRVAEGAAVVAATHDERFVASFARRVVQIRSGVIG